MRLRHISHITYTIYMCTDVRSSHSDKKRTYAIAQSRKYRALVFVASNTRSNTSSRELSPPCAPRAYGVGGVGCICGFECVCLLCICSTAKTHLSAELSGVGRTAAGMDAQGIAMM